MTVDLAAAGVRALAAAYAAWECRIIDPPRADGNDSSRAAIDAMIRTPTGLDWSWADPYERDGDYEWCGAFGAGHCWGAAGLDLDIRRMYGSSTARLNAWGQGKLLFGSSDEKALRVRFPAAGRLWLALDERSAPAAVEAFAPRAGDILLVGGCPGSYRGALACGTHITLVESWNPTTQVFSTIEGNATGEGPRDRERYQGVVRQSRPLGLRSAQARSIYHARRLIRPAVGDLTEWAKSATCPA